MADEENYDDLPEEEEPQDDEQTSDQTQDDEETEEITPGEFRKEEDEEDPAQQSDFLSGLAKIHPRNIATEMEDSYLEYAMSVIVSRALPDVRDGLKPVHRRILYAMKDMGLTSSASFRKSATVVGEVLGKYHPHGDSAVYDSMVRMAQEFSMRYELIRGQGNFGSIDGDSAAAMRYTEAKMAKITDEMLADIDKDTVDWRDNYDGRHQEPTVLPTRLPQLLLNGTTGIAVGMATSIPPHNLQEVIDAVVHLSKEPEASIDDLMQFIKGPDFPTGGILYNIDDIRTAYTTGRGGMVLRGKTEIVEKKNGRFVIIIREIPYQVNKANLITKMAELVNDKKIVGISDIRDESNKDGIRVVIEIKKDGYPKKILNQLFKYTQLQTAFHMNMIALVDEIQPHLLDLKKVLEHFIKHRKVVIRRRTEYDLRIAKARAHILEGLKIAMDHIDEVIATIKKSPTKEEALVQLMQKFSLSELQGKAILDMRLQTLAGLERQKIEDELAEKIALILELEGILADPEKIKAIMIEELQEIREKYSDARRTEIIPHGISGFNQKDTIPNQPVMVTLSKENYIKRMAVDEFRKQNRGGKGVVGGKTKDEDEIKLIRFATNHQDLLYFTNHGRVFKLPVYEIPMGSRTSKGQAIVNLLQLEKDEKVSAILNAGESFTGQCLFMATKQGFIKKTEVKEFANVRKSGLIALKLRDGDSLEWVKETNNGQEIFLVTRDGKCIRFPEKDCRAMGRGAQGVIGIRMKKGDEVVEMDTVTDPENTELLVVMENGLGKMSKISDYRSQSRGGSGLKTANITTKTGKIIGAKTIEHSIDYDLIIISKNGQLIRMATKQIPSQGRATQGVYLMRMSGNDHVASISLIDSTIGGEALPVEEEAQLQTSLPVT